ncbi:MAG: tRNA (adenosine(37)-N6)-threonylcarbamoyltransferase complex transferase subunit TsaD [Verrucomicrobiota bacterium]|nr:tRNA (adenosine(37)-N6)-threonylcarbamoyltransferase complex transferase subunit TsaD [Verrucomicrobiota bacterium]
MADPSLAPVVLAIETSCDETAVALLRGETLLASEVASQIALHQPYGGVVPEVASRHHLRTLKPVIQAALERAGVALQQVDAFAATRGPGLATSLMIGASAAKGLAIALGRPFLAINHLEGHLLSPFFGVAGGVRPAAGLVVSGGHTLLVDIAGAGQYRVLGQTRDDAAGEAFDKVAKLLGLPYPGGPHVNRLAAEGDPTRFDFPRSMIHSGDFHFSFSGLKTSVRNLLPKLSPLPLADLCASFQEAVVDVLVAKTLDAVRAAGRTVVAVSGGVSCNSRLREKFARACRDAETELLIAAPALCTDNAAMIGYVAVLQLARGESSELSVDIDPNLRL